MSGTCGYLRNCPPFEAASEDCPPNEKNSINYRGRDLFTPVGMPDDPEYFQDESYCNLHLRGCIDDNGDGDD